VLLWTTLTPTEHDALQAKHDLLKQELVTLRSKAEDYDKVRKSLEQLFGFEPGSSHQDRPEGLDSRLAQADSLAGFGTKALDYDKVRKDLEQLSGLGSGSSYQDCLEELRSRLAQAQALKSEAEGPDGLKAKALAYEKLRAQMETEQWAKKVRTMDLFFASGAITAHENWNPDDAARWLKILPEQVSGLCQLIFIHINRLEDAGLTPEVSSEQFEEAMEDPDMLASYVQSLADYREKQPALYKKLKAALKAAFERADEGWEAAKSLSLRCEKLGKDQEELRRL
jgi:hypothetical protein